MTAPLAAGYVAAGVFPNTTRRVEKLTAIIVVIVGSLLAMAFGKSPLATILVAQAANGILLPLVALFLLWVVNRQQLLGQHGNRWWQNLVSAIVVALACGLGVKALVTLVWV